MKLAASGDRLAADTSMGAVTLLVGDLDAMTRYYRDVVTLEVISADGDTVTLGRAARPIVVLVHEPAAARVARVGGAVPHRDPLRVAGRPRRGALSVAQRARHLHRLGRPPRQPGLLLHRPRGQRHRAVLGPCSHRLVVDARADRDGDPVPRSERVPGEHLTEEAAAGATAGDAASVGHVHLSVGDVATARSFYVDALGFDETARLGNQAVFVSAGGYHHHMAMNVWNSRGAGPRMPALGLGRVDLALPDADALGELGERLRHHGFAVRDDGRALSFDDPWSNALVASVV